MSVRAELTQAREVAREDPGWLRTWYWPLWLAVVAVGFVVAEAIALMNRGDGGTLSEKTRQWLGIRPGAGGRRGAWAAFVAVLALFTVWFSGHLLQWWPWE